MKAGAEAESVAGSGTKGAEFGFKAAPGTNAVAVGLRAGAGGEAGLIAVATAGPVGEHASSASGVQLVGRTSRPASSIECVQEVRCHERAGRSVALEKVGIGL